MGAELVDGTLNFFGPRAGITENVDLNVHKGGVVSEFESVFSYNTLPDSTSTTIDPLPSYVPANSIIVGAYIEVLVPFVTATGTPTLDVGFTQLNGTEIDFNGLFDAVPVASINTVGYRVVGAGALIGTTVGALDAYVFSRLTPTSGTYSAGQLKLIIRYSPPGSSVQI